MRKGQVWRTKEAMIDGVIHLQVLPQPLILLKEELQSELQIEVNLGGERDDVHGPQVPAVETHQCNDTQNKNTQHSGKAKHWVMLYVTAECSVCETIMEPLKCHHGATLMYSSTVSIARTLTDPHSASSSKCPLTAHEFMLEYGRRTDEASSEHSFCLSWFCEHAVVLLHVPCGGRVLQLTCTTGSPSRLAY